MWCFPYFMTNKKQYTMSVVTAELMLDDLLTGIFNGIPDAQKPTGGQSWAIRTAGVKQNSLVLESKWGGNLIRLKWETRKFNVLPYAGSADGLETWVDIDLGRNGWRAHNIYSNIVKASNGKAYYVSGLYDWNGICQSN